MKKLFRKSKDRNDLSKALTRERLKQAGVVAPPKSAQLDPDLAELFDRVRSSIKSKAASDIPVRTIRKLAGV
jgi:hypothetical protein